MQTACGMISPKARIAVTEIRTAQTSGTILSKNSGRVSIHKALKSSNVTSIQWCLSITGKILLLMRAASGSEAASISRVNRSIEAKPIVSPEKSPAQSVQTRATVKSVHQAPLLKVSNDGSHVASASRITSRAISSSFRRPPPHKLESIWTA